MTKPRSWTPLKRQARRAAISDRADIYAWFAANILPHEPDVRAWLRGSLRVANEDDVIQEAYYRIFAHGDFEQVASGRAWFFTIARNIVLKQMRRERVVRIEAVAEIDALGIVDGEPSAERAVSGRQELARVQRLIDELPERCRLVFQMRKVDALPQREVAARLGISENVVEKEAARGLRLVLQRLGEETGARAPLRLFARRALRKTHDQRRRD